MERNVRPETSARDEQRFAEELADAMFALSTPSRVRILFCLLERPHDVSELVEALGMEQSAISHQLRVLRELALVRANRQGHRRVYALYDEHVSRLLEEGVRHVEHRSGRGASKFRTDDVTTQPG